MWSLYIVCQSKNAPIPNPSICPSSKKSVRSHSAIAIGLLYSSTINFNFALILCFLGLSFGFCWIAPLPTVEASLLLGYYCGGSYYHKVEIYWRAFYVKLFYYISIA